MAVITKGIKNQSDLNSYFNQYLQGELNNFSSLKDFEDPSIGVASITSATHNEVRAVLTNGAINITRGTGLTSSNPVITFSSIELGNEYFYISGHYEYATRSGGFDYIEIQNNDLGLVYSGTGLFDLYSLRLDSYTAKIDNFTFSSTGKLYTDFTSDGYTGTVDSIKVTLNGETDTYNGLNLSYSEVESLGDYTSSISVLTQNDDHIKSLLANDVIDGGAGLDTFMLPVNNSEIEVVRKVKHGGIIIETSHGIDKLYNIENIQTADGLTTPIASLLTLNIPSYNKADSSESITPATYTGPVDYLEFSLLGDETNEIIIGSNRNDFMNLLGGNDAANGGAGDDVLDGGTGSNFLTGGGDDDTFFLDGRGGETTWSTITDFSQDEVNIWGWQEGVSKVLLKQIDGVEGFTGATLHLDLDGNNLIDTSITLTGIQLDDMPNATALSIAGNGYLLIA